MWVNGKAYNLRHFFHLNQLILKTTIKKLRVGDGRTQKQPESEYSLFSFFDLIYLTDWVSYVGSDAWFLDLLNNF